MKTPPVTISPPPSRRRRAPEAAGLFDELVVDNFAGGGGASLGIERATGRAVDIAINHDLEAIQMHAANHLWTRHLQEDVWAVDPLEVTGGLPVGLAWFSPDCKHFSKAKGGKPVSKRVRGLAWVVIRWAAKKRPRVICLENVEEFTTWGPIADDGRPCPKRKGTTFRSWTGQLRRLGYDVQWRELRACDYGAPTTRKRLFLVARCDGQPIVWPEPTHGPGLKRYRTAAEVIDWSLPCNGTVRSVTIRQRIETEGALFDGQPWILSYYGNGGCHPINEPLRTITSRDRFALVMPDGTMRMLSPRELARAQGFPDDYLLTGTKSSQVARIGNSVVPAMAEAIVRDNFAPTPAHFRATQTAAERGREESNV